MAKSGWRHIKLVSGAEGFTPLEISFMQENKVGFLTGPVRKNFSNWARGFTLLEILLTILLVGLALTPLLYSFSKGIFVHSDTENLLIAMTLARDKSEEIESTSYASINDESRAQVSGFTLFEREVDVDYVDADGNVSGTDTGLKRVTVTVYWTQGAQEENIDLATLKANY